MTSAPDSSSERLEIRIHGAPGQPTLIYLPGLHGDWTLVGSFRKALRNRVRFVEFTYPRTRTWSLEEYAAALEAALSQNGISQGWLLGESFGSQVLWPLVARKQFKIEGIILAGGFARHPLRGAVRFAERVAGGMPLSMLTGIIFGYAKFARYRHRHSPETLASLNEFIARRTELDRQAATHRLHLIAQNDPRSIAGATELPIFAVTGVLDPIVPWPFVRRFLKRQCPALREYKILWTADHNVLSTAAEPAADLIVNWMNRPSS